jgi:head-tail adaptor
MNSGLLNKFITIQKRSSTRDGFGGVVNAWVTIFTDLPARLMKQSGDENRFRENIPNQVVNVKLLTFRVRYEEVGDVLDTATYRVLYKGLVYEIVDLQEIRQCEYLDIILRFRSTDNQ